MFDRLEKKIVPFDSSWIFFISCYYSPIYLLYKMRVFLRCANLQKLRFL